MKLKDLTGQRFGKLLVLERAEKDKFGHVCWKCRCDCGREKVVDGGSLKSSRTQSCGCGQNAVIDLAGQKFGRLTAIERVGNDKGGRARFKCRCDCGNECVIDGYSLRSGNTQSCGCLQKERAAEIKTTHGMTGSKIHNIWYDIKTRCCNPNATNYERYGGRGITLYEPWIHDFQAFYDYVSKLEHFGEEGYTLDRIKNDGNYEPGNLRWATNSEQARNRRSNVVVEYQGKQITLAEAAERSGINYGTLSMRYQRGDRGERLFRPLRGSK